MASLSERVVTNVEFAEVPRGLNQVAEGVDRLFVFDGYADEVDGG